LPECMVIKGVILSIHSSAIETWVLFICPI